MRRAPTVHHVPRKPPQCIIKPPASNPSAGNNNPKMPRIGCPSGEVGVTDIQSVARRIRDNHMQNLKGITPKRCYSVDNKKY